MKVEYEGTTYEFPDDTNENEVFEFLESVSQGQSVEPDPNPLVPDDALEYIKKNEGYRDKPYKDSLGIKTVGYGFNLQDKANQQLANRLGITFDKPLQPESAEKLFKHSVVAAEDAIRNLDPDFDTRPDGVRKALLDMSYNLGAGRLSEFEDMFLALKTGNYREAGYAITKSLYAAQVPVRARNNAKLLIQAGFDQPVAKQVEQRQYEPGYYEDEVGNQFYVDNEGRIASYDNTSR